MHKQFTYRKDNLRIILVGTGKYFYISRLSDVRLQKEQWPLIDLVDISVFCK